MDTEQTIMLAQKVDILFRHGKQQGIDTTYHAIADATGETWTNVLKIRKGENTNPGLRTVEGIARYFGVNLDYFQCRTEAECRSYLSEISKQSIVERIRMRGDLSSQAEDTLNSMIKIVLQYMENVDSSDPKKSSDG